MQNSKSKYLFGINVITRQYFSLSKFAMTRTSRTTTATATSATPKPELAWLVCEHAWQHCQRKNKRCIAMHDATQIYVIMPGLSASLLPLWDDQLSQHTLDIVRGWQQTHTFVMSSLPKPKQTIGASLVSWIEVPINYLLLSGLCYG
jgi:hypothetical protein